ncbi:hypothetical protein H4R20_000232 [Coemansia guatemalensis]|uniref:Uncharacterized protein n=1 Tax=Coemansia guatemalensis TaxID=2761395 RepID=A0A9W8LUE0_9FUNG|nr:hypothetical protein H4R20_000232 [Coemansia guatemalensis]
MSQASEGPSSEPWDTENDKILERLALNEENRTPWPELRRIIRQRLAMVVEQLTECQNSGDLDVPRQESERSERPESAEKRKRGRDEESEADETPAVDSSVRLARTGDKVEDEDNKHEMDQTMDTAEGGYAAVSAGATEQPFQRHSPSPDRLASIEDGADEGAGAASTKTQTPAPQPATDGTLSLAQEANGHTDNLVRDIRDLEDRIGYSLHTFEEAPFTIQRIAELLAWPERHYRNVIKFLRAVERVVYVTSTVEEFPTLVQKSDNDEEQESKGESAAVVAETIEGNSASNATATPSSLLSFVASQKDGVSKTDPLGSVAKDNGVAATMAAVAALPGNEQRAADNVADGEQAVLRVGSAPVGFAHQGTLASGGAGNAAPDILPLDASDTGILHLQPTSADEREALRTKFEDSVDAGVPVCIDELDGSGGKVTVVPIHPSNATDKEELKDS